MPARNDDVVDVADASVIVDCSIDCTDDASVIIVIAAFTVDAKLIRYFVVECDTGDTATVERIEVLIVGDVAVGRRAEEGRAEERRAEEVVKNTQEAVVCSRPSVPSNRLRSNERGVERDVEDAVLARNGESVVGERS